VANGSASFTFIKSNNTITAANLIVNTAFTQLAGNANFDNGVLFVDGTNNRVGINTATPTSALDANGNIRTSAGSGGTITAFDNNSSRNNRAILGADANGAYLDSTYSSAGTGTITFRTIGTERVRISEAGNLGIGTTSPTPYASGDRVLQINASTVADIKLTNGTTGSGASDGMLIRQDGLSSVLWNCEAGDFRFGTSNQERVRIDSAGNVGIGTSSPNARLHVVGNAIIGQVSNSSTAARLDITAGGSGFDSIIDFGYYDSFDAAIWLVKRHGADGSFRIVNSGSGSEVPVITVTAGNNVGIGTTNPGYKLQVNGSFAATTKSFVINHPTKPDMKLRYGSLEGPENGVYVRGRTKGDTIQLPDYWTGLVDEFSITVNLTPIGSHQKLYVKSIDKNVVTIGGGLFDQMEYFYTVFAERKDVDKLIVEI